MTTDAMNTPESLLANAIKASKSGRWVDAQASFQAVLNKTPTHTEAMWRLGVAKFFNGDADGGVELIELSLGINPDCAPAHNGLGVIFQEIDELSKAESHFRLATSIEPDDADFLFNLGVILLRRGNNADAKLTLEKAANYAPDDSDTFMNYGVALRRDRDDEGAENALRRAVALDEKNSDALRELAELWRSQNRMNRAYGASLKAVEYDGDNPAVRLTHGGILFELGGIDAAVPELELALKAASEDPLILIYLGRCYLILGQIEKAIGAFENAAKFSPDDKSIVRFLAQARSRRRTQWHLLMLGDNARNAAYQSALEGLVTQDDIVLKVGESTGSGLLAMMAARAGAKRVYTCEPAPETVPLVQQIVERNNLADKITVLPTASNLLEVGTAFENAATVILADILESNLLSGGLLPTLRHAVTYLGVES
ncbi:MAG: tetratricopeptide repeat protein, partial [Alphaproteobacteria bacterium]|nr:tetratricopeptide repeat protein [Alphaproteobacteria bacterium]